MRPARAAGFTLLEVMVALAILSMSLVVLLQIATNNVRASNHSKLITAATFLARGKIVEIETKVLEEGFGDIDQDEHGTFEEVGFPHYRWDYLIEKLELPGALGQQAQQSAGDLTKSNDPMVVMQGLVGGLMGTFMEPIRLGLESSVRRVTLRVLWDEVGRGEQSLEVVTFMADPAKLDMALPTGGAAGGAPATAAPAAAPAAPRSPSLGTFGAGVQR